MASFIAGLDKRQKEATLHNNGAMLILAGAGSGKTRVLTSRIARLVKDNHCRPEEILAVTFTNKAAREMQNRIATLLTKDIADAMTVCTFHSFGVKLLREFGEVVGLSKRFTIMDDNDRTSTLKTIMRNCGKSMAKEDHAEFGRKISLAKNGSLKPKEFAKLNPEDRKSYRVYKNYHAILKKRQAVDFDDLLLIPLNILKSNTRVLETYRKRYKYISIDEFQDTNSVQLQLAKLLSAPDNNIIVVGDDDQGIYSWRGAEISNILNFSSKFKGAKTVILNKNYRSSEEIVNAAYAVIENNLEREAKDVTAASGKASNPIKTYRGDDEIEECEKIVTMIKSCHNKNRFRYKHQAILFRTNAMMRRFEEELRTRRVPYVVQGAMSFFDRKEVKDLFSYLRFFANTDDELSLSRVLKVPNRGITPSTIENLEDLAGLRKISLWDAFERHDAANGINASQHTKTADFVAFYNKYKVKFETGELSKTMRDILNETGYTEIVSRAFKNDKSLEMRLELIEEVVHGLELYEKRHKTKPKLHIYLQEAALTSSDNPDEKKNSTGVTLMTIHKSKGLEYPVIYLPGLDNAIFPSPRAIAEGNIAEERRLFYVGMTRAESELVLSYPATKLFRKKSIPVTPCRFLNEIPEEYLDAPLGEKEDVENKEFSDNFFADMQNMLG